MPRVHDVLVVGGGPAGLAFAVAAATRGLDVAVLERRAGPVDKACGEGILPAGVRALATLGALSALSPADATPFHELRWIDPAGPEARLALPAPGGLGVRRTALSAALRERARAVGAELVEGAEVIDHVAGREEVRVGLAGGGERSGLVLVGADGLASPTRRRAGLDRPRRGPRRFGLRQHFARAAWSDAVEVHFGRGAEAYVTPCGAGRVGVAFLFEREAGGRFEELLERFPELRDRLLGAAPASDPLGAGPLARAARSPVAHRLVLLGDAAGYVDAVTGDGLALAFGCALDLAALLPEALAHGATAAALQPYARAWRRRFRPYAAWTRAVLALSRHPPLRRRVIGVAGSAPRPFERLVAAAVG